MYMRYFATTKDAFLMQIQMPLAGQTEKVSNKQLEGSHSAQKKVIRNFRKWFSHTVTASYVQSVDIMTERCDKEKHELHFLSPVNISEHNLGNADPPHEYKMPPNHWI
ncbi:Protein Tasor 2 [Manis pentadactyla]|nr:Protein Tasor 2 [Manis pentadactyla]